MNHRECFVAAGLVSISVAASPSMFACSGPGACEVPYDSFLLVQVAPDYASGRVEVIGACTAPSCTKPIDAGCTEWRGAMTSADASDSCVVKLRFPDGGSLERRLDAGAICGQPQSGVCGFNP